MESIYTYFDYRKYLVDLFEVKKKVNAALSLRAIAAKIGINSGTLVRILNGERNISKKLLPSFVGFLKLKGKETLYFRCLVEFNQAKNNAQRRLQYDQLIALRNEYRKPVNPDKYEYYENWYNAVIRELLIFFPYNENVEEIAKMVEPEISPAQVKKAITTLQRIKFIKKHDDGYYKPEHDFVSTGAAWRSVAIDLFQKAMMEHGVGAFDRIEKEKRDFSTMTMSFSKEGFLKVRQILKRTREEIAAVEDADKERNQVFQLNFQLFPLSKPYLNGAAK
ncbi:MAG: TIGR02147 family protein [Chitinispirillaceae bacterium]|nr:TIGR02147 family protein [Chitinispirillaceae bacterium]